MEHDSDAEAAWRFLRGHYGADLRFDDSFRAVRYVFNSDGRMIAPVMVAMLQAFDTVLFVPECADAAMEVLVTLVEIDEAAGGAGGAAADRWRIHHGQPEDVHWAEVEIDSVKHGPMLIDGSAFLRPNPLAEAEAAICRHMNTDHVEDLRRLALHHAGVRIEAPVLVGVDPGGIDIRGRFEVIRVEASESIETREDARRVLTAMAAEAADAEAEEEAHG